MLERPYLASSRDGMSGKYFFVLALFSEAVYYEMVKAIFKDAGRDLFGI